MKYLAFSYIYGLADGGMKDFKGEFDTIELAKHKIEQCAQDNLRDREYIGHIVRLDNDTLTVIGFYKARSSHDGVIDTQEWLTEGLT